MAETHPTYEELQARVAELEAARKESEWRLRRLATVDNPRDKILLGLWEQLRATGAADRFQIYAALGSELVPWMLGESLPDPAVNAWVAANPTPPIPLDTPSSAAAAYVSGAPVANENRMAPATRDWIEKRRAAGIDPLEPRSGVVFPLQTGGEAVGVLQLVRLEVCPFTDEDIAAIQPYADQMALAIGNARLAEQLELRNRELAEAVAREAALARVSRRINEHPTDLDDTLLAVASECQALCGADNARVNLIDGDDLVAASATDPATEAAEPRGTRMPLSGQYMSARAVRALGTVDNSQRMAEESEAARDKWFSRWGWRSGVATPITRGREVIGTLFMTRREARPFTAAEIATLEAFASQAAIAIETARSQQALAARNAELAEALEQQTAMAEVLDIIGRSPTELQPVLDAIVERAARLLESNMVTIQQLIDGELVGVSATVDGQSGIVRIGAPMRRGGFVGLPSELAVRERRTVHVFGGPSQAESEFPALAASWRASGGNSAVITPLVTRAGVFGVIVVRREAAEPYTERQIALLETFADQAVIAIENARLFNELQESNAGLETALTYQTATSDVLGVVGQSTQDSQPVFDAIVNHAGQLSGADMVQLRLLDSDRTNWTTVAGYGTSVVGRTVPLRAGSAFMPTSQGRTTNHFFPTFTEYEAAYPVSAAFDRETYAVQGWGDPTWANRAFLAVPLVRDGQSFGGIYLRKSDTSGPFPDALVALVETFAAQAVIAIENARLFREQQEAVEQLTATAEVLEIVSKSPTDVRPVFQAVAERAGRLCGAESAYAGLIEGEDSAITLGAYESGVEGPGRAVGFVAPLAGRLLGECVRTKATVHFHGTVDDLEASFPLAAEQLRRRGLERVTSLTAPLVRNDAVIGGIQVQRLDGIPFTDRQVALLETFAAQAVIAIENARLFREQQEAVEQLTATAEVLEIVSKSPTDIQPVLDAIAEETSRLCEAEVGGTFLREGDSLHQLSRYGPEGTVREDITWPIEDGYCTGEAILGQRIIHYSGSGREWAERFPKSAARRPGMLARDAISELYVPLMRGDEAVGVAYALRSDARPFTDRQVALVETFAAQAVIAIENARLFNELQDRNREVTEALEREEATSEILRQISRAPEELQQTLQAIGGAARELTGSQFGVVWVVEGDALVHGGASIAEGSGVARMFEAGVRWALAEPSAHAEVLRNRQPWVDDDLAGSIEQSDPTSAHELREQGYRSRAIVPILREADALGVLVVIRNEVRPFTPTEVSLLESFADQAAIAIDNARLLRELRHRNREVTEALEREEATSAVLSQISRSPENLSETLSAIAAAARRLTGSEGATVYTLDGSDLVFGGFDVEPGARLVILEVGHRQPIDAGLPICEAVRLGEIVLMSDYRHSSPDRYPGVANLSITAGSEARSGASIPIMKDRTPVGAFNVVRTHVREFTPADVALLESFADQAAIAIENARLFREQQEAVEQLTATAEVLEIVASFSARLEDVLRTVVARAAVLCNSDAATYMLVTDGERRGASGSYRDPALAREDQAAEAVEYREIARGDADNDTPLNSAIRDGAVVHVWGTLAQLREVYADAVPMFAPGDGEGETTRLFIPVLRDGEVVGTLNFFRVGVRPYTDKEIALLQTFADQAAIAIENARLFREIQEKTREVEEASKHKSEFLANMSHELRTPLNAIIGYAELLQEECADLGDEDYLPDLKKIHSAGQHLLTLISGILDLSKIEAGRMTMFLEDFDIHALVRETEEIVTPLVERNGNAFLVECPGEIGIMHADLVKTRQVLFNLLSNAAKFTENGTITLRVTTEGGAGGEEGAARISFAISDTGIGMTADVMDRLFEAFGQADASTSRKYGGTGLGLALSREFCRMMGGDIIVESTHGEGSTFTVVLPVRVAEPDDDGGAAAAPAAVPRPAGSGAP